MGTIPRELCDFSAMEALFLDTNNLNGPIPECFGELTELRQLYLFQNQLTGSVPPELEELSNLSKSIEALAASNFSVVCNFSLSLLNSCIAAGLGLEQNKLTGEVPDGVCLLAEDSSFDLWADCTGTEPLLCSCCTVCCPSSECI
jgi:LRR receptor-like serine/threonine-protein kinase FLS2